MKATALLADDEPLLAHSLAGQLRTLWPELEVVAVCHDGQSALDSIHSHQPDIAFLDINMPFLNGMDIATRLNQSGQPQPLLVFVTAYDQYAIEAFEQQALDYLLKPGTEARLRKTIERLQQRLQEKGTENPTTDTDYRTHLSVSVGQKRLLLSVADIAYFQSDGKYTRAIGPNADYLLNEPLKQLETELPPDTFWRIHRSAILNTGFMDYSTRTETGRLEVFLKGMNETLIVSRKYLHRFVVAG